MIENGRMLLYRSLAASWSLCAVATRRHSGLSTREIALIKAMLGLGKKAGFHSGRIQSYFSRPDRNVNPARIYEIRDGTLRPDIAPASETELHDFLLRFESIPTADDQVHKPFPRLPTPAYIGVLEGRIRILPRSLVIVEQQDDYRTREKLLQEQRRIVAMLSDAWGQFQVEQHLEEHLKEYGRLAETDQRSLNIFALDTEFNTVNKALGSDTGGLGQKGEIQWERLLKTT
jgi:hypothetical protein